MTETQARALRLLREKGPLLSAEVGEGLWPDRRFKSRQGAAHAGGGLMGKLRQKGWVDTKYERGWQGKLWCKGWILTVDGRIALRKEEER